MSKLAVFLQATVPEVLSGKRLDYVLAQLFDEYSRSVLQNWVKSGYVKVDDQLQQQVRYKVAHEQEIKIEAILDKEERWQAQDIPLDIVFEDDALLVINKPPGLIVHPGAGNPDQTLVNALLHYAPELAHVPRAGLIHRLDKDTSGLLLIARTLESHHALTQAMQAREIKREYQAIVNGVMVAGGRIEKDLGRHPTQRTKMAVLPSGGRPAITHYRVLERFRLHTLVKVTLETGRTHQIRVHMAHIKYPVVGDTTYGKRLGVLKKLSEDLQQTLLHFKRQALHAVSLGVKHPVSGEEMTWQAPLPDDMQQLLILLKEDAAL